MAKRLFVDILFISVCIISVLFGERIKGKKLENFRRSMIFWFRVLRFVSQHLFFETLLIFVGVFLRMRFYAFICGTNDREKGICETEYRMILVRVTEIEYVVS